MTHTSEDVYKRQGIHAYNECVDIAEIIHCAKVYFGVLDDLIGFEI